MADEGRRVEDAVHLLQVPLDCRVHILSYLTPTELYARYARCSRLCSSDSLGEELPQATWGEFHVGSRKENGAGDDGGEGSREREIDMESLLQRIARPSFERAWRAPRRRMRILGHERDGEIVVSTREDELSFEEMQEMASDLSFEDVTVLDLSVGNRENEEEDENATTVNRVLPRCLPWLLSSILPGLVELDFSNLHGGPIHEGDYISELSLFNSNNCPNIRTVIWNNRAGGCYFLRGKDLKSLEQLRELYIDNILCDWRYDKHFAPLMKQFFEEDSTIQRFFFFACNSSLQRVSLRGGKYVAMGSSSTKVNFPQWALMRFVRRTPALRWFRSDLTEENVKVLSEERPEIEFCS